MSPFPAGFILFTDKPSSVYNRYTSICPHPSLRGPTARGGPTAISAITKRGPEFQRYTTPSAGPIIASCPVTADDSDCKQADHSAPLDRFSAGVRDADCQCVTRGLRDLPPKMVRCQMSDHAEYCNTAMECGGTSRCALPGPHGTT